MDPKHTLRWTPRRFHTPWGSFPFSLGLYYSGLVALTVSRVRPSDRLKVSLPKVQTVSEKRERTCEDLVYSRREESKDDNPCVTVSVEERWFLVRRRFNVKVRVEEVQMYIFRDRPVLVVVRYGRGR